MTGYYYDTVTSSSNEVFTVPLRDVAVLWGESITIYTTPSGAQNGYVYTLEGENLSYVTQGQKGLMGITANKQSAVVSYISNNTFASYVIENTMTSELPVLLFAEKCVTVEHKEEILYCATPREIPSGSLMPDDWYKGTISLQDALWEVDLNSRSAQPFVDMTAESGRDIDVISIGTDPEGKYIWFINKNDDSLWLYDTTISGN